MIASGLFVAIISASAVMPANLAYASPAQVEYQVLGPGKASIKYEDGNGIDQHEDDASLPWNKTTTFTKSGHITLLVFAWGSKEPLTCSILVNGAQVATKTQEQPLMCEADIQAG